MAVFTHCNVLKLTKECQNIQRDEQTRETVRHVFQNTNACVVHALTG